MSKRTFFILSVFYLLAACFAHRHVLFSEPGIAYIDWEYKGFILPRLEFFKYHLTHMIGFWWNPYILAGTPFLSHPEVQFFYLPRWICYILFSPEIRDRVFIILHVLILSIGLYAYVKNLTKSVSAGFLAGFLAIFCGPTTVMIATGNEITLPMLAWWPIILLSTDKFMQDLNKKHLAVIVISLIFSILAQQLQNFTYIGIFYVGYVLLKISYSNQKNRLTILTELLFCAAIAIFCSMIQLLPTIELVELSNRLRTFEVANSDGLQPYSLLTLFFPAAIIFSENNSQNFVLYFGLLAVLIGIFSLKSSRTMYWYLINAGMLIVLSCGLLYGYVYNWFPFAKYMNGGEELTFNLVLAIPILSAAGWSVIKKLIRSVRIRFAIFILILLEIFICTEAYYANVEKVYQPDLSQRETKIAQLIKNRDPYGRFIKYGNAENIFHDNISMSHRIFGVTGFFNFMDKRFFELVAAVDQQLIGESGVYGESPDLRAVTHSETLQSPLMDLLSVRYIVTPEALSTKQYNLLSAGDYNLYEKKEFVPRVMLIDQYEIKSKEVILEKLTHDRFDIYQSVFLEEQPKWLNKENDVVIHYDDARIVQYFPNRVKILADAVSDKMLFLSDQYYPGWKAFIDGQPTSLYQANYAFRAIAVPKGEHVIDLVYSPKSVKNGVIFLINGLVIFIVQQKRKRLMFSHE